MVYCYKTIIECSSEKPKTAKQLEKERIKKEKAAKFAEKQAKLAAAKTAVSVCHFVLMAVEYDLHEQEGEAGKNKKKTVGKQVVTYDIPTPPGDKKGS